VARARSKGGTTNASRLAARVSAPDKVADGAYRLGTRWVGWYLCEIDGAVTVVDCGRAVSTLELGNSAATATSLEEADEP
jgi:hypothetical protein